MDNLAKANQFIEVNKSKVNLRYRHKFHYMSEAAWINDPNGFSIYNGEYHLFAQHYPYESKWGPMHWAHATTKDFIKWEHQPIALAPDKTYEMDLGCFSGTAIEHEGQHILMYTACKGQQGNLLEQEQCIAIGNGITYEKLECNPVITAQDLPSFATNEDFRDPKILCRDGIFYALLGTKDHSAEVSVIVLFKSENLKEWEYVGEVIRGSEEFGVMFECPDLFRIDGKDILITSPINMPEQGERFQNYSSTVYFVGKMDFETGRFHVEYYDEIDGGFDFYAPQTVTKENGDVIMMGWHQMWERYFPTFEWGHGWAGAMSIPRHLALKENKLYQAPIDTLTNYMTDRTEDITQLSQDCYRLKVKVNLEQGSELRLSLLKTSKGSFDISYDKNMKRLVIDRSKSIVNLQRHEREAGVENRRYITLEDSRELNLDILVDISSVEVFVNGGRYVLSSNYYTADETITSELITDYKDISIEKWNIEV